MENFLENIKYFRKTITRKTRRAVFLSKGVYIDVHDQEKTPCYEVLHSVSPQRKNKARYKQVKARRIFMQGVYIDVHDQIKIRRNDELRRIFFVFLTDGDRYRLGAL